MPYTKRERTVTNIEKYRKEFPLTEEEAEEIVKKPYVSLFIDANMPLFDKKELYGAFGFADALYELDLISEREHLIILCFAEDEYERNKFVRLKPSLN